MSPAPTHPIDTKGHPIILIGLMGCGKTTVGKMLSKRTGMPLLDTDAIIEEQTGCSIQDIFREHGEAHFRSLETALLRYLLEQKIQPAPIISTGGGIVVRPENRDILRRLGFTVWLNVSVRALLHRTKASTNRPLLQSPDRHAILSRLLSERRPFYREAAHYRLNSTRMDIPTVVSHVCRRAERFFDNLPPHGLDEEPNTPQAS
ncbi:MAG: shikimate kinase [Akkermansia sp.]|nr:shikimate kinase [Akkermansia sp.]